MSIKLISQIPVRQLIYNMQGQNYWFNGCMEFLMECLGEDKAYDYWFFSGVTGDSFIQMYSKNPENMVLCYSHNMTDLVLKKAFDACGYNYNYYKDINNDNREALDQRIRKYIDHNTPVIARVNDAFHSLAIICGYDNNDFYYILGEEKEPKPYRYDELIFVTDKKSKPLLADVYRKAVMDIPSYISMIETKDYSFGKKAFMDWAESFQNGMFDAISSDSKIWYTHANLYFSCWNMHGTYLCILGTNGCAEGFLHDALAKNPDMTFINELIPLYITQNRNGFDILIQMESGFNIKPEVIKNKNRMRPISNKIMELSRYCDEILTVFKN
ncbi:MAG: hypothetical protein VB111_05980 [Clostridiaceae bacterium]|nr:hypothetical protein [Clostridiaceae bacterium]